MPSIDDYQFWHGNTGLEKTGVLVLLRHFCHPGSASNMLTSGATYIDALLSGDQWCVTLGHGANAFTCG